MVTLINFVCLCCAVFLFAEAAEPIQDIKTYFNLGPACEYKNAFQWFFLKLLNCSMCAGFWIGLFYYKAFLLACLVSVCSELISKKWHKI